MCNQQTSNMLQSKLNYLAHWSWRNSSAIDEVCCCDMLWPAVGLCFIQLLLALRLRSTPPKPPYQMLPLKTGTGWKTDHHCVHFCSQRCGSLMESPLSIRLFWKPKLKARGNPTAARSVAGVKFVTRLDDCVFIRRPLEIPNFWCCKDMNMEWYVYILYLIFKYICCTIDVVVVVVSIRTYKYTYIYIYCIYKSESWVLDPQNVIFRLMYVPLARFRKSCHSVMFLFLILPSSYIKVFRLFGWPCRSTAGVAYHF